MSALLPVQRAHQLDSRAPDQQWLVEHLWAAEAVGIIGGEPKCGKSFLALDLAVAVASGQPCLGRFRSGTTGRVLLYAAEDAPHVVRQRLEGICATAQIDLATLDLFVITAPSLGLDRADDRERLTNTVEKARATLLVLDPFVRLHHIDENAAGEVAPLLAYLRQLQRKHHLAVAVVHHARKGAAHTRPGQALRGSSEFHAWGDSNLYLRRRDQHLRLSVEHRAARSLDDITLELATDPLALRIADSPPPAEPPNQISAVQRIEQALVAATVPLTIRELRAVCRIRSETLCAALDALIADGRVIRSTDGYSLAA